MGNVLTHLDVDSTSTSGENREPRKQQSGLADGRLTGHKEGHGSTSLHVSTGAFDNVKVGSGEPAKADLGATGDLVAP